MSTEMTSFITPVKKAVSRRRTAHFYDKEEFRASIIECLKNDKVQRMKKFNHHSRTSCFKHCIHVAYYNYKICKFLGLDEKAGAKGGMLHDLFLYDWHTHAKSTGNHFHGMTHPNTAYLNARRDFDIDEKEKDIIVKHMWPLTLSLPRHKETAVICFTDKFCGFCEVLDGYFSKAR